MISLCGMSQYYICCLFIEVLSMLGCMDTIQSNTTVFGGSAPELLTVMYSTPKVRLMWEECSILCRTFAISVSARKVMACNSLLFITIQVSSMSFTEKNTTCNTYVSLCVSAFFSLSLSSSASSSFCLRLLESKCSF